MHRMTNALRSRMGLDRGNALKSSTCPNKAYQTLIAAFALEIVKWRRSRSLNSSIIYKLLAIAQS